MQRKGTVVNQRPRFVIQRQPDGAGILAKSKNWPLPEYMILDRLNCHHVTETITATGGRPTSEAGRAEWATLGVACRARLRDKRTHQRAIKRCAKLNRDWEAGG